VYQDFYLIMRERHKGLVKSWQEVTDPLKHVYEVNLRYLHPQDDLLMQFRTSG
jgi:hypothetical protein